MYIFHGCFVSSVIIVASDTHLYLYIRMFVWVYSMGLIPTIILNYRNVKEGNREGSDICFFPPHARVHLWGGWSQNRAPQTQVVPLGFPSTTTPTRVPSKQDTTECLFGSVWLHQGLEIATGESSNLQRSPEFGFAAPSSWRYMKPAPAFQPQGFSDPIR